MRRSESILKRDTETLDEAVNDAVEGTPAEQLIHVIQSERAEGEGMIRPFLVIDLRSALSRVRGSDVDVPGVGEAAEAASELTTGSEGDESRSESDGRGLLSRVFVLGLLAGVGYALWNRDTSPEEAAAEAADEAETLAERAATVIQRRGEVAAERIEEGSELLAEQLEERGSETADKLDEASDQIEDVQEEAEEKMEDAETEAGETVDEVNEEE